MNEVSDVLRNYCWSIYNPAKSFGSKPHFIGDREVDGKEGFISLYSVTTETKDCIIQEGSTVGFKGIVGSERLWIDCDSYEAADKVEAILIKEGYDYVAYDTGNRGAHFGVLRDHPPSHLLPQKDKEWVRQRLGELADSSIYTHLHLFRLPGTVHEKTGRRKELVKVVCGRSIKHEPLRYKSVNINSNNVNSNNSWSIFDYHSIMGLTTPRKNGDRHPTLVKLCYALKDMAKVDANVALWWLTETSKLHEEPKEAEQIEQIVRSIYGGI